MTNFIGLGRSGMGVVSFHSRFPDQGFDTNKTIDSSSSIDGFAHSSL